MKAVVTGATKGIGRAIVELFLEQGVDVIFCARNVADIEAMTETLSEAHPERELIGKPADMSNKQDVLAFANVVNKRWGTIDILVNNAGVFLPGEIHKEEAGNLEFQIETNLYSAYHLTRALLANMITQKSGHIFNMCSVASFFAYPNGGSYSISKFALLGFSKVLREELKDKGIKVTSVMPGATWSASWDGVDLPRERLMEATDIAKSIWAATQLSPSAVVEDIILRPQLGDL